MFEEILPELVGEKGETKREGAVTQLTPTAMRCCFVDGGNGAIYESATARVEFLRIYGTIYDGRKRVLTKKEEGFILVKRSEGKILVRGYNGLASNFTVPENDPELSVGKEKVALGTVASLARYILECRFLGSLGEGCDLLVRDGSVVANNKYEQEELDRLPKTLCGLSKTNTLAVNIDAPGIWVSRVEEREGVNVGIVKLHERSEYIFRLDALELEKPAAALAVTAGDAAFPGYPYPLIEADKLGRVSNQELETLKMRFKVEAGTEWKGLEKLQHSTDAHGVLDTL